MYRVRYYSEMIHPDHFSKGLLGWYIRVLNWLRWRLETCVQHNTLKYLAREGGLPKQRVGVLTREFALDVAQERLEKQQTSPRAPVQPAALAPTREARYVESPSPNVLLEEAATREAGLPLRPRPLDEMVARHLDARASRYAKGRRFIHAVNEDDIIPV